MKKIIFAFILGAVIFSTITAIAVTSINASSITYTDSNNNEITVKTALDNVYSNLNSKIAINTFDNVIENYLFTTQKNTEQTSSVTLNRGKYLIVTGQLLSGGNDSKLNGEVINKEGGPACENCQVTKLFYKYYRKTGSSTYASNSYFYQSNNIGLYYVQITNDDETVTLSHVNSNNATKTPVTLFINAIPINE